jgi:hypothetical protein
MDRCLAHIWRVVQSSNGKECSYRASAFPSDTEGFAVEGWLFQIFLENACFR